MEFYPKFPDLLFEEKPEKTNVIEYELPAGHLAQFVIFMKRNLHQVTLSSFLTTTFAMFGVAFFQAMGHSNGSPSVARHLGTHQVNAMESIAFCSTFVCVFCTKYFSIESNVTKREMKSGTSVTAYWFSKQILSFFVDNVYNVFAYFIMYWSLVMPLTPFGNYYWLFMVCG